jgi:hypothetical protein
VVIDGDSTITDGEGYYAFEAITTGGALNLKAIRSGYVTLQEWVTIEPGENTVNLSMTRDHGSLEGYVTDTATALGLDSVHVVLESDTVTTDADGYYIFESVSVGTALNLEARRTGYVNYQNWIVINPGENTQNIVLAASGD